MAISSKSLSSDEMLDQDKMVRITPVADTIDMWHTKGHAHRQSPMSLHSYVWAVLWYKIRMYHSVQECGNIVTKLHKIDYCNTAVTEEILNATFTKIKCNKDLMLELINIQNDFSKLYKAYSTYCFNKDKSILEATKLFDSTYRLGRLDLHSAAMISNSLIDTFKVIPNIGPHHYIPVLSKEVAEMTKKKVPNFKTSSSYISGLNKVCAGVPSKINSFFTERGRLLMECKCTELYGVKLY